jgi:hypothetical protein
MNLLARFAWIGVVVFPALAAACEGPCAACAQPACADESSPSWIFRRSTYTHDPYTGARVAQYQRLPAIEPLEDERLVTSRYHRQRTNMRGVDGSVETYYDVQAWGNGRGGLDAEWERYHDAWKESILQGGYYNQGPGFGYGYPGQYGYGGYGYGGSGFGYGNSGYGFSGYGNGGANHGGHAWSHGGNDHNQHGDDGHDESGGDHHGHNDN